jgi:hypothetical protein
VRVRHCAVPHFVLGTFVLLDILLSSIPLAAPRHLEQREVHHSPKQTLRGERSNITVPVDYQAKLEGMTGVRSKDSVAPAAARSRPSGLAPPH